MPVFLFFPSAAPTAIQASPATCAWREVMKRDPARESSGKDADMATYRTAVGSALATAAPYLPSWNWKHQCVACSLQLFHSLKDAGYSDLRIMNSKSYHLYLTTKKGLGTEGEIIVDPTYQQFFGRSETQAKASKEPSVFVGTRADLVESFKQHQEDVLAHYLKWREGLLDSDLKRLAPSGPSPRIEQIVDFCYGFGAYQRTDATESAGPPEALRHFYTPGDE